MNTGILLMIINLVIVLLSVATRKLTTAGGITGGVIAIAIYTGVGMPGVILLGLFFLMATMATSVKSKAKAKPGPVENNRGRRDIFQVFANGGVAALAAIIATWYPSEKDIFILMIAAAFSSASADTVSSELGSVYGRRFYKITSLTSGTRGDNGVVSIRGSLAGLAASIVMAAAYYVAGRFYPPYDLSLSGESAFFIIVFAGTCGNLADSLLGEIFENRGLLNNNAVNFLNTSVAVLVALLCFHAFT